MTQPIRALLLAAGFGTRLRPITLSTPKCLVAIGGLPLLERWLQSLEASGCSDALVNTHYLADQVHTFLAKRPKSTMNVQSTYEPELLGTAGTLLANQSFFEGSTGLLIHADNATDFNINELIDAHKHRPEGCLLTMLTFDTDNPQSCGIVEIDEQGVVQTFHEKVKNPPGNRANGAIYAFDSQFIQELNTMKTSVNDLSTQVIPKLVGRIATLHIRNQFLDIGTPDSLQKAQELWPYTS
jgi:mannose-1-phosphate guanylyltransferase